VSTSEQDAHHTPPTAVGREGWALHQNGRGAATESRHIAPEGFVPIFLQAYGASTHNTTGLTPASLVFGREHRLPCDLLFGVPPSKERPTIDHAANLVDHLHDIHNYARQFLKLANDQMKTRYGRLTARPPTRETKYGSIVQSSWVGLYKVVTRINNVVYKIQIDARSRMIVINPDRLYQGLTRDERPWGSSRNCYRLIAVKTEPHGEGESKHRSRKIRNGGAPVSNSGRVPLRRDQCTCRNAAMQQPQDRRIYHGRFWTTALQQ
jgi:hypothetical protein